jgi:hypothetical protein
LNIVIQSYSKTYNINSALNTVQADFDFNNLMCLLWKTKMIITNKQTTSNWPGWDLNSNEHGTEFDELARERMVAGGLELSKYIDKYLSNFGESILEVGPFFNPITKEIGEKISTKLVTYWDNDPHVIQWLHEQNLPFDFIVKKYNLNNLNPKNSEIIQEFDSMIASQIFNYIDSAAFLRFIRQKIYSDGLIFVNNVVEYGLPKFFVENRPKSIEKTIELIKKSGFEIVDYEIIPTKKPEFQKNDRLLLVARRE